jgi:hypothetical protein
MPPRAEGRSPSHAGSISGRFGALARALLPALSTDPASDLTGRANGHERVLGVLERHRRELQSLVPNGAGTGMTRLSCWSPAARDDRPDLTHAGDCALSPRGAVGPFILGRSGRSRYGLGGTRLRGQRLCPR